MVQNVRSRMVYDLEDLLRRRTNIAQWIPKGGFGRQDEHRETVLRLAELVRSGTGRRDETAERLVDEYRAVVERANQWRARHGAAEPASEGAHSTET
jgi:hypothetical protein